MAWPSAQRRGCSTLFHSCALSPSLSHWFSLSLSLCRERERVIVWHRASERVFVFPPALPPSLSALWFNRASGSPSTHPSPLIAECHFKGPQQVVKPRPGSHLSQRSHGGAWVRTLRWPRNYRVGGRERSQRQGRLLGGGTELNFLFLSRFDGRPEERGGILYEKAGCHLQSSVCVRAYSTSTADFVFVITSIFKLFSTNLVV